MIKFKQLPGLPLSTRDSVGDSQEVSLKHSIGSSDERFVQKAGT